VRCRSRVDERRSVVAHDRADSANALTGCCCRTCHVSRRSAYRGLALIEPHAGNRGLSGRCLIHATLRTALAPAVQLRNMGLFSWTPNRWEVDSRVPKVSRLHLGAVMSSSLSVRMAVSGKVARPAGLEPATSWFVARRREATGGSERPLPPCLRASLHTRGNPSMPRAATDCQSFVSRNRDLRNPANPGNTGNAAKYATVAL
jgi:hypothetical protein